MVLIKKEYGFKVQFLLHPNIEVFLVSVGERWGKELELDESKG